MKEKGMICGENGSVKRNTHTRKKLTRHYIIVIQNDRGVDETRYKEVIKMKAGKFYWMSLSLKL